MPYVTLRRTYDWQRKSYKAILLNNAASLSINKGMSSTVTRKVEDVSAVPELAKYDMQKFENEISRLQRKYQQLIAVEDKSTLYQEYKIPKQKGGFRDIAAPNSELKTAQEEIAKMLSRNGCLHHTAAYAYVENRSCKNMVQYHQKSNFFLKTDFHNFFGSINSEYLFRCVLQCFPFSELSETGKTTLKSLLSLCFLRDVLPQGSPASPLLSNLVMIPFDYLLEQKLAPYKQYYSRYADDIVISSQKSFNWKLICKTINDISRELNAPLRLNKDKTRYGSINGSNWMLGLMLNNKHKITLGHEGKRKLKAMLHQAAQKNSTLKFNEVMGKLAYWESINPDDMHNMVRKYLNRNWCPLAYEIKRAYKKKIPSL